MVGSDGGVFSFGDAALPRLDGQPPPEQAGRRHLADARQPRLLVASRPTAACSRSTRRSADRWAAPHLNKPVNGLVAFGNGYLMVASDGGVFDFSNKAFVGSLGEQPAVRAHHRHRRVHDNGLTPRRDRRGAVRRAELRRYPHLPLNPVSGAVDVGYRESCAEGFGVTVSAGGASGAPQLQTSWTRAEAACAARHRGDASAPLTHPAPKSDGTTSTSTSDPNAKADPTSKGVPSSNGGPGPADPSSKADAADLAPGFTLHL